MARPRQKEERTHNPALRNRNKHPRRSLSGLPRAHQWGTHNALGHGMRHNSKEPRLGPKASWAARTKSATAGAERAKALTRNM